MSGVVTVVGSLHYDIMVDGAHLPRLGETAVGQSWHSKFGGKGRNQAVAAASGGASTRMIGCVGADEFGRAILDDLDRQSVGREGVEVLQIATGMSVAISQQEGDYGAVIVSGANLGLDVGQILKHRDLIEGTNCLVLQNEVPEEANIIASEIAKSGGGFVILNAAPARPTSSRLLETVDLLVVNEVEASQMSSVAGEDRAARLDAAVRLSEDWKQIVVTAGGSGIIFAERDRLPVEMPAEPVRVRSTHGAGDCFVGTLAAFVSQGFPMTESLEGSVRAAGRFVAGL